jgi:hypothetical protein
VQVLRRLRPIGMSDAQLLALLEVMPQPDPGNERIELVSPASLAIRTTLAVTAGCGLLELSSCRRWAWQHVRSQPQTLTMIRWPLCWVLAAPGAAERAVSLYGAASSSGTSSEGTWLLSCSHRQTACSWVRKT